jgi:hypothetical protein
MQTLLTVDLIFPISAFLFLFLYSDYRVENPLLLRRATEENTYMADPPPYTDSNSKTGDDTREKPDPGSPPSTPRWVKVFGIIVIVLVLLFVILHLTGGGLGGHTPLTEHGVQQP